jgi:cytochrome b
MQGGKMRPMAQPVRRPTGPPKPRIPLLLMRVWDGPTRLFHWAIVLLVVTSYLAVQVDWMQVHYWSGYTMLTLLLFRLVWGFIGSETSRFRNFLRSPVAGLAHVAAFGKREPDREIGHNAAGGWPTQKLLNRVHHINFNIILGLIALHILAILVYAAVKRQDLVRPMVTGKKRLPANMRQPRFANPLLAVLIVAAAAICVWALVRFA